MKDAKKGVVFESFPPVLYLQLKGITNARKLR
jgi:hypothetical protein